jgi:hypothetical protein
MTRALVLELALAMTGSALGRTLTCEMRDDIRYCFDHQGYLSTESGRVTYLRLGQSRRRMDDVGA